MSMSHNQPEHVSTIDKNHVDARYNGPSVIYENEDIDEARTI